MPDVKRQGGKIVAITFIAALLMAIMPLPEWSRVFRPEWVSLVIIYWCIAIPDKVNIGTAWILGLCMDVLTGTLLGQHALAFSVIAYISVKLHKQIRIYPLWQQALSVFILIAFGQLLILWIQGLTGESGATWAYWASSMTSALIWPIVFMLLRSAQRNFRIA